MLSRNLNTFYLMLARTAGLKGLTYHHPSLSVFIPNKFRKLPTVIPLGSRDFKAKSAQAKQLKQNSPYKRDYLINPLHPDAWRIKMKVSRIDLKKREPIAAPFCFIDNRPGLISIRLGPSGRPCAWLRYSYPKRCRSFAKTAPWPDQSAAFGGLFQSKEAPGWNRLWPHSQFSILAFGK